MKIQKHVLIMLFLISAFLLQNCESSTSPENNQQGGFIPLSVGAKWNYYDLESGDELIVSIDSSYMWKGKEVFIINNNIMIYNKMFYSGDTLYGFYADQVKAVNYPGTNHYKPYSTYMEEEMEVPAGTFKNPLKIMTGVYTKSVPPSHYMTTRWFVKGVGPIAYTIRSNRRYGNNEYKRYVLTGWSR